MSECAMFERIAEINFTVCMYIPELISRMSTHPCVSQTKVHRPWALFCKTIYSNNKGKHIENFSGIASTTLAIIMTTLTCFGDNCSNTIGIMVHKSINVTVSGVDILSRYTLTFTIHNELQYSILRQM